MGKHTDRPECFRFAMDFLGDPENEEIERYIVALEQNHARLVEALRECVDWCPSDLTHNARTLLAQLDGELE